MRHTAIGGTRRRTLGIVNEPMSPPAMLPNRSGCELEDGKNGPMIGGEFLGDHLQLSDSGRKMPPTMVALAAVLRRPGNLGARRTATSPWREPDTVHHPGNAAKGRRHLPVSGEKGHLRSAHPAEPDDGTPPFRRLQSAGLNGAASPGLRTVPRGWITMTGHCGNGDQGGLSCVAVSSLDDIAEIELLPVVLMWCLGNMAVVSCCRRSPCER